MCSDLLSPSRPVELLQALEYNGSTMGMELIMAVTTLEQPRNRRFQLRATASEEELIKVAAHGRPQRHRVHHAQCL